MDNIQILNVRPNRNSEGAYVGYSALLKPTDHTVSGNFTASDAETKQAFDNNQGWNGFKQLVINRLENDVKGLITNK